MWWTHYGFSHNPLDIRPTDNVVGLNDIEKKVIRSIENGEIFLLYGPIGCGKTSLAITISKKLEDRFSIIYLNGEETPKVDLTKLVNKTLYKDFIIFKIKNKKPIVLILDELQNFSESVIKQAKALYDNKKIHSLFLIQVSENIQNATPSFINRIHRKIPMDFPDENTIIEIVKQRLNGKLEFDEELLREIILINNRNVRSILIDLNRILDELEHPISEKITKDIVKIRGVESYKDSQNVTVDENIRISPQQAIILEKLLGNELTIKQLSELTNLPYNTVSKQISRLVEKGLLLKKEKDKKIYYSINPAYLPIIMKKLGK